MSIAIIKYICDCALSNMFAMWFYRRIRYQSRHRKSIALLSARSSWW